MGNFNPGICISDSRLELSTVQVPGYSCPSGTSQVAGD
jgi:hypothetical protein